MPTGNRGRFSRLLIAACRLPLLHKLGEALQQDGELRVGSQDILLDGLSDGVASLGGLGELLQEVFVFATISTERSTKNSS